MKFPSKLILAFAALGAGIPAARAQVYAEQVMAIGRNVLAMDDYVLAIQYFNHAAQAKPYLWDPYYYRALAKLMLDDFQGAEKDASEAIDRNKFKYEAYRVRGFARMRMSMDSAAVEDFDRGLYYSPDDKYFLYYKGIAQASMEKFEAADSTLSHLLALYPRFEEGYGSRAQMHFLAGDTVRALGDIEQSLRLNPNMTQPRLMRTEIELKQGRWAEAAADMDTVINLTPADADLYINRAYARYNCDNWTGAMEDYDHALSLEPDNYAATYNRALLRFQVQDLQGAKSDFTAVLAHDPDDFPARYNRGLICLDLGQYKAAMADFRMIASRYPRFYPVYYAMSQAEQGMGHDKAATDYFFKANDLITRYTANPRGYQLDRPTIQNGATRERSAKAELIKDSPEDVMEHFNELVTISQDDRSTPLYGDKLRGRVQDIDMRVQPESPFTLVIFDPTSELHPRSYTYAELTDINSSAWLNSPLFYTNDSPTPEDADRIQELFDLAAAISAVEAKGALRPIDRLQRAVANTALKNYGAAKADLDEALRENPTFVSALLQRAYVAPLAQAAEAAGADHSQQMAAVNEARQSEALTAALADYEAALQIDPRLSSAWMGKGCVLYAAGDYQGAGQAFTRALELEPSMGPAYFNRALAHLKLGQKPQAQADLSRAGELGLPQAYNLLKKL